MPRSPAEFRKHLLPTSKDTGGMFNPLIIYAAEGHENNAPILLTHHAKALGSLNPLEFLK
jgi:hypothetical protein